MAVKAPLRINPYLVKNSNADKENRNADKDNSNADKENITAAEEEIEVAEEAGEEEEDRSVVPPLQLEKVEVSLLRHPTVENDVVVRVCGCPIGLLNYLGPSIAKYILNPVSELILFPRKVILAKNQQ